MCRLPAVTRAPHHTCAWMEWPFPLGTGGERAMACPHAARITGQRNKGGNARSSSRPLGGGIFLCSGGLPVAGGGRCKRDCPGNAAGASAKRGRPRDALGPQPSASPPKRHRPNVTAEASARSWSTAKRHRRSAATFAACVRGLLQKCSYFTPTSTNSVQTGNLTALLQDGLGPGHFRQK